MRAEAEYKRELAEISMKERHAKAAEKCEDAKANKLKFGANMVKFEPPKEQRGG